VKEGQLLATMEAPELQSQLASAQSRVKSQEAIYMPARLIMTGGKTSKTPGTISQNDVDQADARKSPTWRNGMPRSLRIAKWSKR